MEDKIIQQFYDLRKKVTYDTREFEVKDLCHLYHSNKLYLSLPTGNTTLYSKIIECMLLGYPNKRLNVIADFSDLTSSILKTNSEQIRALITFVDNKFKLINLSYLTELNSFYFKELPDSIQNKILNNFIRVIVVSGNFSEEYFNFN